LEATRTREAKALKLKPEDTVWCVVMFDLPVQTKTQRKEATRFRSLLIDSGYSMIQFSVYGKYSPTLQSNKTIERFIRANLPAKGEVRLFHLTDNQWASATRFVSRKRESQEPAPEQLTLF
jgi:CRISPR-associated protein Cas2